MSLNELVEYLCLTVDQKLAYQREHQISFGDLYRRATQIDLGSDEDIVSIPYASLASLLDVTTTDLYRLTDQKYLRWIRGVEGTKSGYDVEQIRELVKQRFKSLSLEDAQSYFRRYTEITPEKKAIFKDLTFEYLPQRRRMRISNFGGVLYALRDHGNESANLKKLAQRKKKKRSKGRTAQRSLGNSLVYYEKHYPGLSRGRVQIVDPSLYKALSDQHYLRYVPFADGSIEVALDPYLLIENRSLPLAQEWPTIDDYARETNRSAKAVKQLVKQRCITTQHVMKRYGRIFVEEIAFEPTDYQAHIERFKSADFKKKNWKTVKDVARELGVTKQYVSYLLLNDFLPGEQINRKAPERVHSTSLNYNNWYIDPIYLNHFKATRRTRTRTSKTADLEMLRVESYETIRVRRFESKSIDTRIESIDDITRDKEDELINEYLTSQDKEAYEVLSILYLPKIRDIAEEIYLNIPLRDKIHYGTIGLFNALITLETVDPAMSRRDYILKSIKEGISTLVREDKSVFDKRVISLDQPKHKTGDSRKTLGDTISST
ncbi:hypothetical protein HYY69_06600 [Candidatus Woesearchaeota archaeon]|nr:hypothetical protein [Candidatus Woesearchaeota archaeon]